MPLEGQFLGRYRLLRLIGSGGMGEVYLAEDPGVNRQVAIKVMRTEVAANPETDTAKIAARLFQREAQAIARLDHPHILPLYDYGEQKIQSSVLTYLVMPYRPDGSLAHWLRQNDRVSSLSLQDVAHLVHQIASALQYAQDHQIIHQDVKPTNFLVRLNADNPNRPDLLLTDFGLAKLNTLTSSMSQSIRGTPAYMAPEQCEGHSVPASDQYALAVMVYELLTGQTPFQGKAMQVMYAHVHLQPQPPSSINPRLPHALDAVILRGLAKKPEDRFPSISAFATAFQQALSGIDTPSPIRAASPAMTPPPNAPGSNDLYATLTISEDEAHAGTTRTLTLPGGRRVQVSIPAGAYDRQVINVKDQDVLANEQYPAGAIHLTLSIVRTPGGSLVSALRMEDKGDKRDDLPAPELSKLTSARRVPLYQDELPSRERRQRFSINVGIALVGLTLLLVLGSAGLFYYVGLNNQYTSQVSATATARAHASRNATATFAVQATATGVVNAHATATVAAYAAHGVMFGFDAQHTGVNPYETTLNSTNVSRLVLEWSSDQASSLSLSSVTVVGGLAYIGSDDGRLYAFDTSTGHIRWVFKANGLSSLVNDSTPAVINGVVYGCLQNRQLYALDALTGKLRWVSPANYAVNSAPTVNNGVVYVVGNGRVYAFDAATGHVLWISDPAGSGGRSPAVANGVVYVGSAGQGSGMGRVYAFDATTGRTRWVSDLIEGGIDSNSSPTVANGLVYIGSGNGGLAAFDAATGHVRWVTAATAGSTGSSPAVAHGIVYFTEDRVYAFDATTGKVLWTTNPIGAYNADSPLIANGVVYVGSAGNNNVYALDATSGRILWSSPRTGGQVFSVPAVANGAVYISSNDARVYAFHMPNTTP